MVCGAIAYPSARGRRRKEDVSGLPHHDDVFGIVRHDCKSGDNCR